jgi:hypothetical protein
MLDERVLGDQPLELLLGREVVGHAVLLAVARPARRVRDGEAEAVRVGGEEALQQRGFAGARGPGDDDGPRRGVWLDDD